MLKGLKVSGSMLFGVSKLNFPSHLSYVQKNQAFKGKTYLLQNTEETFFFDIGPLAVCRTHLGLKTIKVSWSKTCIPLSGSSASVSGYESLNKIVTQKHTKFTQELW